MLTISKKGMARYGNNRSIDMWCASDMKREDNEFEEFTVAPL